MEKTFIFCNGNTYEAIEHSDGLKMINDMIDAFKSMYAEDSDEVFLIEYSDCMVTVYNNGDCKSFKDVFKKFPDIETQYPKLHFVQNSDEQYVIVDVVDPVE